MVAGAIEILSLLDPAPPPATQPKASEFGKTPPPLSVPYQPRTSKGYRAEMATKDSWTDKKGKLHYTEWVVYVPAKFSLEQVREICNKLRETEGPEARMLRQQISKSRISYQGI